MAGRPIKVFLAGIIQGSKVEADIHGQDWREPIKRILEQHLPDADVYCHYTQHPNSIRYELPDIRSTFADGLRRAAECDLLIAYLPSASMGTAVEMHEAFRAGAVVLTISPLEWNWVIRVYSDRLFANTEDFFAFVASRDFTDLLQAKKRL